MEFEKYREPFLFSKNNLSDALLLGVVAADIINKLDSLSTLPRLNRERTSPYFDFVNRRFVQDHFVAYFYSLYLLEQTIHRPGFEFDKFFSYLGSRLQNNFNITYDLYPLLLINYDRVFDRSLSKHIIGSNSRSIENTRNLFFDVIPYIKTDSQLFVQALSISIEGIKVEDNYLNLYSSLQILATNNIEVAKSVINYFITDEEKGILIIPHVFNGLIVSCELDETFLIASGFILSKVKYKIIIGLRCLNAFAISNFDLSGREEELIGIFNSQIQNEDEEIVREILYCYGRLLEKLSRAKTELFILFDKYPTPMVKFTLSQIIHIISLRKYDHSLFVELLSRISSFDSNMRGVYHYLILSFTNIEKYDPDIIYWYLTEYINDEHNNPMDIEGFKRYVEKLAADDIRKVEWQLTIWLNKDNNRFHIASATISSILWIGGYKELCLSSQLLDTYSFYDIEFILYKIAGYISSKEHLESLLFSSLKKTDVETSHAQLVVDLFVQYVWFNYPGCINYLEQKRGASKDIEIEVIDVLVEYANAMNTRLKDKPKELMPSIDRMQIFMRERNKINNVEKSDDKFREKSFIDFARHISLKVGNSSFFKNTGEFGKDAYSIKSTTQTISRVIDFPAGEFIDPVGQAYSRYLWRNFKRRN